jgi:UDP-2-acetamido-2-deoxy-ribo-hexuluronate aminotransferase
MTEMTNKRTDVQMVDVVGQYCRLKENIDQAIQRVLHQGNYINGQEVKDFSAALENYLGVQHVIPCANGTDALQAALMALDLEPGDEVITTSFSFISTVEVIVLLGLRPVLVDVDPDTFNIDPGKVLEALTPCTRAVIPVHLFGQAAAMTELIEIARQHNLYVIEDSAQSLGGSYRLNGQTQKLGTMGEIGCTSFFPTKNLGGMGDGGACFTNDARLAERMRMIVNHGSKKKYLNERVGMNSRLDTLQAAVLMEKLKHLDDFILRRQEVARKYIEELMELKGIKLPVFDNKGDHSFNQFTIRVADGKRDAMKNRLLEEGIPSMVYYPIPLHKQPVFESYCGVHQTLAVSEMLSNEVLSLPIHTEIIDEQQDFIIETIKEFFEKYSSD